MAASSPEKARKSSEKVSFYQLNYQTSSDDKGMVDSLEVTVIPVDDEPYSKIIKLTP